MDTVFSVLFVMLLTSVAIVAMFVFRHFGASRSLSMVYAIGSMLTTIFVFMCIAEIINRKRK